ncbi:MAG: hypothetical protein M5R40_10295 [Anaerolineae bacterium]|nr:hypothetical protein [Anaerolineae bacterium]
MRERLEINLQDRVTADQLYAHHHLPFDVPEGTGRIDVRYEYSAAISAERHVTGGNTIDIGLFDARGVGFMAEGFRGWSGSERREFFVAQDDATPATCRGRSSPVRGTSISGSTRSRTLAVNTA